MICKACQTENDNFRLFCSNCGEPFSTKRHTCGFINEEKDNYCGGCGVKLKKNETVDKNLSVTSQPTFNIEGFTDEEVIEILDEGSYIPKSKSYSMSQEEIDSLFRQI